MADETQNEKMVRPTRNAPAETNNSKSGIGEIAGWLYIIIALFFDVIGIVANLAFGFGSTVVMIIGYIFFMMVFFIFSGVNVFSGKYILLFLGSMVIEMIPVVNVLPATSVMVYAIVSKSRSSETGLGVVSDIKTLTTNKITRGKGSKTTNQIADKSIRTGGNKAVRTAQSKLALERVRTNMSELGSDVKNNLTSKITRPQRSIPKRNSPQEDTERYSETDQKPNNVLDLSNSQINDTGSRAA